jgi:hypothetical protein
VILHETENENAWSGVSLKPVAGCPMFHVKPPQYVTSDLVGFVRDRLEVHNHGGH